jgi:hypothetical protein
MQRVAALSGLIVCACLVAGCGGSALQEKARKVVGDPQATVVSTQTVDPLGGGRVLVVVMRPGGSQGLGCAIAASYLLAGSRDSLASGCPRWSDAYLLMNPTTHAAGIDLGISKWQVAAIAKARATSPRFQMFPSVNQLAVRCPIPHASPSGGTLSGACFRRHSGTLAQASFLLPERLPAESAASGATTPSRLSSQVGLAGADSEVDLGTVRQRTALSWFL